VEIITAPSLRTRSNRSIRKWMTVALIIRTCCLRTMWIRASCSGRWSTVIFDNARIWNEYQVSGLFTFCLSAGSALLNIGDVWTGNWLNPRVCSKQRSLGFICKQADVWYFCFFLYEKKAITAYFSTTTTTTTTTTIIIIIIITILTHSLHVQDIIWKADCHSACQKIFRLLMGPESLLPCSQKPATGPYPEPAESSSITICPRSVLMLFSHLRLGLPSGLLLSGLPNKTL
jgi:hypothetical protein